MEFEATRLEKTYEMTVPAPVNRVFPLLCPTREYAWVPYWNCEMVFSRSGYAEPGCVFRTDFPDRGKMTWVTTKYEPPAEVQYTVFKHDSHVWNLSIRLSEDGQDQTSIVWNHEFTALTEDGNAFLSQYTDEAHKHHLGLIEKALFFYLETGEMLQK